MIFNSVIYENSMPDGIGILEVIDPSSRKKRLFVPLSETHLSGVVTGPLASFQITQVFSFTKATFNHTIEAIYRFPLPGDAMITSVQVSFGEEILKTTLKERDDAADEYHNAFEQGRKGVLLTRETPDIFTLHLTGIEPDAPVRVEINFLQYAMTVNSEIMFRIPLTVAPRYIRNDEMTLSQRNAKPQLLLIDPGHKFSLDLTVNGNSAITSPSHQIRTEQDECSAHVTLTETEAIPDRDFVLVCHQAEVQNAPLIECQIEQHPKEDAAYLLTTITTPKPGSGEPEKRELIILVDHSGSMSGPKWKAADWTVKNLLQTLQPDEYFNLGVFHTNPYWVSPKPIPGTKESITSAVNFLKNNQECGGTNLGIVLEQALANQKSDGNFVRHIVIITDAEVTDEGRLIRMVRNEQKRNDPRTVSVICIDAAPNTPLVSELVRVGKGIARFLTSDPSEQDITTALSSALISWKQPYKQSLSVIFNRNQVESVDEITLEGQFTLNSLPYGIFSRVYRIPLQGQDISVTLQDAEGKERYEATIVPVRESGIRELFGSSRIRTLEQIQGGFYSEEELDIILKDLGYNKEQNSLYPETKLMNGLFLDELIVTESLRYGIPSSRTAFVCTSPHPGTPVKASVIVPTAYPEGWDVCDACVEYSKAGSRLRMEVPPVFCAPDMYLDMCLSEPDDDDRIMSVQAPRNRAPDITSSCRSPSPPPVQVQISCSIPISPEKSETRFNFDLPPWRKITGLQLMTDVSQFSSSDVTIEIYLGTSSAPVALITLADLVDGEIRPLNIACEGKNKMTVVLKCTNQISMKTEISFQVRGENNFAPDVLWM